MMSKHSLFLISSRQGFFQDADRAVANTGPGSSVRIGGRAAFSNGATAPAGLEAIRSGNANVILLDLDSGIAEAFKALESLANASPDACVLAASATHDPDLILRAVRAGAADFLALPLDSAALTEALSRTTRKASVESTSTIPRGRVMSFISAKGGCGATSVAVNLAITLSRAQTAEARPVILLDLDSPGGDAAAMLKLEPTYSLADIAANIHRLDMDLLNSMALRHDSGLMCLAAAGEGAKPGRLEPGQMATIVAFLQEHFDVVLAGGGLGDVEMAAVNLAHMVHVVSTLDFLSLKRAQGIIVRLREFGVTGDALRVVVNKLDKHSELTSRDARQALDAPVVWSIPYDQRVADRAVNEGVPYTALGRNRLQAAFDEYATLLGGELQSTDTSNGVSRLFRRLVPGRAGMPA
jgi:pilus assembly protein CpaE